MGFLRKMYPAYLVGLAFCLLNCSKPTPVTLPPSEITEKSPAEAGNAKIGVCALLTSDEIASVQGEPVKETKSSVVSQGALAVTQCYFALPTASKSIVVTVTQKGEAPNSRDPREYWKKTFHHDGDVDEGEKSERGEEEERTGKPEKIEGVGEEAFWLGGPVGGALHVLKGESCVRIAVGGPGDLASKLAKSKALADFVLKRL